MRVAFDPVYDPVRGIQQDDIAVFPHDLHYQNNILKFTAFCNTGKGKVHNPVQTLLLNSSQSAPL